MCTLVYYRLRKPLRRPAGIRSLTIRNTYQPEASARPPHVCVRALSRLAHENPMFSNLFDPQSRHSLFALPEKIVQALRPPRLIIRPRAWIMEATEHDCPDGSRAEGGSRGLQSNAADKSLYFPTFVQKHCSIELSFFSRAARRPPDVRAVVVAGRPTAPCHDPNSPQNRASLS